MITRNEFDVLGQPIHLIEACGTEAQRSQQFRWHPSGQREFLILENPDTGQQVTKWLFGSTVPASNVARNNVVIGKQYPTGESSSYTVNRQGEVKSETQPNGTVHEYSRNKLGQIIHDRVTTLGPSIDDAVLRISTTFNNRGLEETITTWDNATNGSGALVNQVIKVYDAFNQMISDQQEHSGVVDANTPKVDYTFSDGSSNTLRLTAISAPSGKKTAYNYGTTGSIEDSFNRPASLKVDGETDNLVEYEFTGLALNTKIKYPAPDAELHTDYDRFARITDMPWQKASDATVLAHIQYGYDAASRRTWRKDLTPAANGNHDRAYTYDSLSQVKSADVGALNLNQTAINGKPSKAESWNHDETGNWLDYQKAEDGTTTIDETRRHNESNQINVIDGQSSRIAHDLNGNTTILPTGEDLQGPLQKLIWNPWNMLAGIRNASDAALIGQYAYDGRFRRTTVTDATSSVSHTYYNNQWRSVEERENTSVNPSAIYFWGAQNRWELIRRDRDTSGTGTLDEELYCVKDAMDPIAIVNSSGAVEERYDYTVFGTVAILAPDYTTRTSSSFDWNFLFHGEFRDTDTGMYNYGFRYYEPETGRWRSRDPIGEIGGENSYAFTKNSPHNQTDSFGLFIPQLLKWIAKKFVRGDTTTGGNYVPAHFKLISSKIVGKCFTCYLKDIERTVVIEDPNAKPPPGGYFPSGNVIDCEYGLTRGGAMDELDAVRLRKGVIRTRREHCKWVCLPDSQMPDPPLDLLLRTRGM